MYDASGVHLQAGRQAEVFQACHFSLSAFLLNKTVINKVHLTNFILRMSRALQPPPFYGYEGIGVAELFDSLNRCAVLFSMTLLRIT
jgi:hypothetical protein